MIEQQGRVVAVDSGEALVQLGGRAGCPACDAGRGCGAGLFGRMLRRRGAVMTFDNHLEARAGQAVVVGLPETWFLSLVARFYLFPLLAGLAGGALGHYVSGLFGAGIGFGDLLTLIAALLGGAVAFWRNHKWSGEFPGSPDVHLLRVVDNDE
jgi:sigma-E factor negative regulatory protein RseC